jgi:hypothetical protein
LAKKYVEQSAFLSDFKIIAATIVQVVLR